MIVWIVFADEAPEDGVFLFDLREIVFAEDQDQKFLNFLITQEIAFQR